MNALDMRGEFQLLSGNHAVALGVSLARPDVAPVYPITPQTPILEKLIELQSKGAFGAELLTPESEHSAMAACIGASATGARVFTATSSQGLMLMHELLHYAAGGRCPIVMFNVNRTPAAPWGFWPDQTDSLAQRDTGWVQLYSESPQESLDLVIEAFRVAEAARLPVMINHDAFYVSHAVEPVKVPTAAMVADFVPPTRADFALSPEAGRSFGAPIGQEDWNQSRRDLDVAMKTVVPLVTDVAAEWEGLTGRAGGPVETYRCEDADVVFVTMGSMAGTAREAVDAARARGVSVGLVKVRLFRPMPAAALRAILKGRKSALVLDRNYSPGMGGVLQQELKSLLYGMKNAPNVHGFLTGVGGVNVPPLTLENLITEYGEADPSTAPIWVE